MKEPRPFSEEADRLYDEYVADGARGSWQNWLLAHEDRLPGAPPARVDNIPLDLAVLLATVNRATMNNRSSAPVPEQARRRLCMALGVQRLDETPDEIAAKLRAVLKVVS